MRQVFIDTGAFYAVLNRTDQHHREAALFFEQAVTEAWRLLTSNFIVAETYALVLARLGRDLAAASLQAVPAAVIRVTTQDEAKAGQILFASCCRESRQRGRCPSLWPRHRPNRGDGVCKVDERSQPRLVGQLAQTVLRDW